MNMNETFVLFDMVPRSTMEATGSQNVDIRSSQGNPKLGCTVTLVVTTDGRKGRAEVNFRGLAPDGDVIRQLQANAPDNVRVTGSPQGWARHQSLIEWLQALIVPFVAGATFLLLLDRYPAHRNQHFVMQSPQRMGQTVSFQDDVLRCCSPWT
ncbi:uncharacterized protein LOC135502565 [Lineus longissimus]|uniref:uncharacterized protein LOC135502565 n=1 Tax=Lineus longissimus TaxID=88925 RepID=UPI00315CA63C